MSLTKVSYSMINGAPVNVLDYGASPSASSATNTTAFQAAIDAGFPIYIPSGTYNVGGLTLRDGSYLFGDGVLATKLVYTGTGTFINAERATDLFNATAIYIEKIAFDGVTKGTKVGLSLKFRHDYAISDCNFANFSTLIRLDEPYLGTVQNVSGTGCDIGFDFVKTLTVLTLNHVASLILHSMQSNLWRALQGLEKLRLFLTTVILNMAQGLMFIQTLLIL
jgi:hypothetical protein